MRDIKSDEDTQNVPCEGVFTELHFVIYGEMRRTGVLGSERWCPGPDLNRHARVNEAQDFKSCVSTNFTTRARVLKNELRK